MEGSGTMPNKGASREAIQFHYDLGNRFYARLLGESMIYSAGLWDAVEGAKITLSEAQNRKLDWHIAAAGLNPGQRLLDVGCGWGGLMARAVAAKDLSRAVGLTLSDEQAAWIEEGRKDPRITVQNRPWQEFKNEEPFDAIVSIGAIEHFARPEMDTAAKLDCYSGFFEFCSRNLVDGGRLSLQSIIWMNMAPQNESSNLPLDFFPESNLPRQLELVQAADPWFHLVEMHNRPRDYSRTLREWIWNLRANRDALKPEFGEENIQRYQKAFAQFMYGFDSGITGLSRFSFVKKGPDWSSDHGTS
ncbi:MAG: cyclopropane-fatty-acyl-phospholipid synthase family protein [Hoeflea sp.]|nr:cyclopropane-fatty-acyl-phospholipid synthase family protein [Hoeflea sp.]MBV1762765.1 cyclopropane-fatty-acyl-phospholipid synthase family protein [Hoeflea sp.]